MAPGAGLSRPSRIGFFLPHLRHGGAESVVLTLLRHLDRAQFQPLLILQRQVGDYLSLLPPDIEVIALRRPRPPLCVAELARLLGRRQIDLIYTATNATNIYATAAARLARRPGRARARVVISEHTPLAFSLGKAKLPALRRAAIRRAYPLADLAVAPLDQIGAELRDFLGPAAPPFLCLPNPVVETLAPARDQPPIALRIASVGRLAAVKRFDLLIAGFAEFHARHPAATLTLFGDGPERRALEDLAAALGLGDAVSFAGYVADVPARLAGCDLFVCTSEREGFGNAIVEAMAAGVPVLSVDCPFGPRLLLAGGRAGRLVGTADAATLGAAMTGFATDPAARLACAAAGREVAASFGVAQAVAAHEQAFAGVLAGPSGPARQERKG